MREYLENCKVLHIRKTYLHLCRLSQEARKQDFPGGTVVKNPPANAGDTGSNPGLVRSHMPQSN